MCIFQSGNPDKNYPPVSKELDSILLPFLEVCHPNVWALSLSNSESDLLVIVNADWFPTFAI